MQKSLCTLKTWNLEANVQIQQQNTTLGASTVRVEQENKATICTGSPKLDNTILPDLMSQLSRCNIQMVATVQAAGGVKVGGILSLLTISRALIKHHSLAHYCCWPCFVGCGGAVDWDHADKCAATVCCYHANIVRNLWGIFSVPCWIYATNN